MRVDKEKSLKNFIGKMGQLCTDDKITGKRIDRSNLLDYLYELDNPVSEFSMTIEDMEQPRKRIEHLFLFKHLAQVDTRKAERCEDLVNLCALYGYKEKYNTEKYDTEITTIETRVATEPIPEVDTEFPVVSVRSGWR